MPEIRNPDELDAALADLRAETINKLRETVSDISPRLAEDFWLKLSQDARIQAGYRNDNEHHARAASADSAGG